MKKLLLVLFAALSMTVAANAQSTGAAGKHLPSVNIKTIDGKSFNTKDIKNDGKPIIVSFWALWCKNCIKELNAFNEVYDDWAEETGVKIYAVSIDDAQRNANAKAFANSKGWEFELLSDSNQDFKRAMNVGDIPHLFILNGKGEIVWQHTSYSEGGEDEVYEILKKVAKGEKIK
ncbi:MAG: TlpA family protein disulfide reductase [Bacteroidales bacterium]|nr:TlpA family protein disulfide reductase [Bacteroidales bacterium]